MESNAPVVPIAQHQACIKLLRRWTLREVHHLLVCSYISSCHPMFVYQKMCLNCLFIGIWSAAMDGDVERVRTFIKKGIDPNTRDQANYTALVCSFYNSPLMQTLLIMLIS